MTISRKQKEARTYLPQLKEEGVKHLVGSPQSGVQVQLGSWTVAGTTSEAVTFESMSPPMSNMETADYAVLVDGPVGDETASLKTTTGFTISSGTSMNGITLFVVVIGQPSGSYA